MKDRKTIKKVYNMLDDSYEDENLIKKTLSWVLEQDVVELKEILPHLKEPELTLSKELYKYGEDLFVWGMEDPSNPRQIFITKNRPNHTPKRWWKKYSIEEIENPVYGENYFRMSFVENGEIVNWIDVESFFQYLKHSYFNTREEVYKYVEHYTSIDKNNLIILSSEKRKQKMEQLKCNPRWLEKNLMEQLGLEKIYIFKKDGEIYWAMKQN